MFGFWEDGVTNSVRKLTSEQEMHSLNKHEPGVYVRLICLTKTFFPLFSSEINTHFLFFFFKKILCFQV